MWLAVISHVIWSLACFVFDVYRKMNNVGYNLSRAAALLVGYLVFGGFLLAAGIVALVSTVFMAVDERKYSYNRDFFNLVITTSAFAVLGWLCSAISALKLSCIVFAIFYENVDWIHGCLAEYIS